MSAKTTKSCPKQAGANAALALGMGAGFAFLVGLGAALGVLSVNAVVMAGCGLTVAASVFLLLSRK